MRGGHTLGPMVAGGWYPGEATALRRALDGYLERGRIAGVKASALIAPHAGYAYSGAVAGRVFGRLGGLRPTRVIVLGPSHYHGFRGAAIPAASHYATPLGRIELDRELTGALAGRRGFLLDDGVFEREHSLEMQLPFLQHVLPAGWRLIPMLVGGGSSAADCARIAEGLRPELDDSTLMVVSSDFTHFGAAFGFTPFESSVEAKIRELDMGAIGYIRAVDAAGFESYVARTGATICGRLAIGVLLRLCDPRFAVDLAAYDTSGRQTGDWAHTVSYAGLTLTNPT